MLKRSISFLLALLLSLSLLPGRALALDEPVPSGPPAIVEQVDPETPDGPEDPEDSIMLMSAEPSGSVPEENDRGLGKGD